MPAISIFSSSFCKADQVAQKIRAGTGFNVIQDKNIVSDASAISGISSEKLVRAFAAQTSVFNKFTREKECSVAYLKLATAQLLVKDNVILNGFCSQLIPDRISHLLQVALIADLPYRLTEAEAAGALSAKEARRQMRSDDENCAAWVDFLHRGHKECWNPNCYDLFIPMHKTSRVQASALIIENALKPVVQPTETSRRKLEDFHLAARVEVALALEGHNVEVGVKGSVVTLNPHKQVLLRGRLEEELRSIAGSIDGVELVTIDAGHADQQADIYCKHDCSNPSRVLLVDDERELVQTLSERLQMREVGSAVAYDGPSALQLVQEDDPEVMIIDLKMPGIDGIEVLRRVKEERPEIEVIILTGQGSKADEAQCLKLGAFGFLQKPVDIEKLGRMLKRAHSKIQRRAHKGE
jgi:CheY-like chemotaxis protein